MANRIEIEVVARDMASGVFDAIKESIGGTTIPMAAVAAAGGAIMSALKESANAAAEYAAEVEQIMFLSGKGAEESSRFVQLLGEFGIATGEVLTATRKMTAEGWVPSIEALGQMSDQYRALNTQQERNQFLLDNLGRSGLEWADVMSRGSGVLNELSMSVDENLVLNEQAIQDAKEYTRALDEWERSVQGLKVSIGTQLLPVLTSLSDRIQDNGRAAEIATERGYNYQYMTAAQTKEVWAAVAAERAHRDALLNIPSNINTIITTTYKSVGSPGQFSGYAAGGMVRGYAGGANVLVGEMGPEVVTLPRGSYVHTAGESRGSGGFNLQLVYSPGVSLGSEQALMDFIEQGVRKMQMSGMVPS